MKYLAYIAAVLLTAAALHSFSLYFSSYEIERLIIGVFCSGVVYYIVWLDKDKKARGKKW